MKNVLTIEQDSLSELYDFTIVNKNNIIIFGPPGIGKTAMAEQAINKSGYKQKIKTSYINKDITHLEYTFDKWYYEGGTILKIIAPYVQKGSSIKLADENFKKYWTYLFDGKEMDRRPLSKEFIDYSSEKQLLLLFNKVSKNLLQLGISSKELKKIIYKLFVEETLL